MPELSVEDFVQAVKAVVKVDERWIPTKPGTSLYIRPFMFATDPFLEFVHRIAIYLSLYFHQLEHIIQKVSIQ